MGESNALYYSETRPIGAAGDFITAPEISQMFGEMIGIYLASMWRAAGQPPNVHYVELGPGRGTLAHDALRTMTRFGLSPSVHFVEGSPSLRAVQSAQVADITFHEDVSTLPDDGPILMVANEFFDALALRQLLCTDRGWYERMVGLVDEKLAFVSGNKPMDAAIGDNFKDAPIGAIVESSPASAAIMKEAARRITAQAGCAVVIDYGYGAARLGSSLQAVQNHTKIGVFDAPGRADLTFHVDFAALAESASAAGARCNPLMTQGDWLRLMGIGARAEALSRAQPERMSEIALAHHRLTHADEMGDLFKVLTIAGGNWTCIMNSSELE